MARSRRSRASSTPRLLAASISTTSRLAEPFQMRRQFSHSPQGSPRGRDGVAALAVERHGEDAGRGGLADAARAGQQVAVAEAATGDGAAEGGGDVILHQQVGKAPRTIPACKGDGHGGRTGGRTR